MKKIFTRLFVFLGILFCVEVIGILYLVVADPLNLRPLVMMFLQPQTQIQTHTPVVSETKSAPGSPAVTSFQTDYEIKSPKVTTSTASKPSSVSGGAPTIPAPTPEQVKALESVGLSVSTISKISPSQKICFENILGSARVAEITGGAVPTMAEFLSVRDCFSQ